MKPIYDAGTIQIEVTNACNLSCSNCTRFVGHHPKPYYMDLDVVRAAIESLDGFQNCIGLMGGEPTIHPQFSDICRMFKEMIPDAKRRGLWTNGCKWKKYEIIIMDTFLPEFIAYNDHQNTDVGTHQILLIAAKDVIEDEDYMWELIDNCWIQKRWSASITPKGAFFCEVAAAQDHLFNGPGGYPIEKGWWEKNPEQFQDQVKRYCPNCSAAIPMVRSSSHIDYDIVSKSIAEKLKNICSPKYLKGKTRIFDKKLNKEDIEKFGKDWTPWNHRPYRQYTPNLIKY